MRIIKLLNRKYSFNVLVNFYNLCKKECIIISIENLYFKYGVERKNFFCFFRLVVEVLCWFYVLVILVLEYGD